VDVGWYAVQIHSPWWWVGNSWSCLLLRVRRPRWRSTA